MYFKQHLTISLNSNLNLMYNPKFNFPLDPEQIIPIISVTRHLTHVSLRRAVHVCQGKNYLSGYPNGNCSTTKKMKL